ncbi:MAG: hypothetical protein KAH22_05420 [Thiotrichaceae bacterium]|nr:hypothetical protein [Thiotrichaceae bacterium]
MSQKLHLKPEADKPKTASKAKVDKPKTASKAKADKPKTATNPMNERDKELSDKELNDLLRSVALRLNTPIRPAPRQKAQPTTKSSSSKPGPAKIVNTRNNKKKDDKESNKKKQSNSNRPASPPSSGWIYLGQIVDNQWVSKTLNIENGRFPQSGNTYLIDATSVNVRRLPTRKDPNNEPFHWFKQGAKVTVLGYKSGHSKHYWVEIKMQ